MNKYTHCGEKWLQLRSVLALVRYHNFYLIDGLNYVTDAVGQRPTRLQRSDQSSGTISELHTCCWVLQSARRLATAKTQTLFFLLRLPDNSCRQYSTLHDDSIPRPQFALCSHWLRSVTWSNLAYCPSMRWKTWTTPPVRHSGGGMQGHCWFDNGKIKIHLQFIGREIINCFTFIINKLKYFRVPSVIFTFSLQYFSFFFATQ